MLLISINPVFASGSHSGDDEHNNRNLNGHNNEHDSSIGEPTTYAAGNRQIDVYLKDSMQFAFNPALTSLKAGEPVTFMVINAGNIPHEFSIGTSEEQQSHMVMMKNMPNMMHHDKATVSLAPGEHAEINWVFTGEEQVLFSCNIPGQFEAGMHHEVDIL